MLEPCEVSRIAGQAASATPGSGAVSRILTHFATDSDRKDALLATILFPISNGADITGDSALNPMVRIPQDLDRAGERQKNWRRMTILNPDEPRMYLRDARARRRAAKSLLALFTQMRRTNWMRYLADSLLCSAVSATIFGTQ